MGASSTKPDVSSDGQTTVHNNNTAKDRGKPRRGKARGGGGRGGGRGSSSPLPSSSSAPSSPATQKREEEEGGGGERDGCSEVVEEAEGEEKKQQEEEQEEEEAFPAPAELTEAQMAIIRASWKVLEANVARVGVVLFIKLFETHPDVQEVFMPFKGVDMEEVKHSKQLRAHGLRVMGFVNKAVARLGRPDKLLPLISDCGKSHFYYGANIQYIDYVGPQFIASIRPAMEEEGQWCTELEEAWELLFQHIAFLMKTAMKKEMKQ